jgi:hypothetical protein
LSAAARIAAATAAAALLAACAAHAPMPAPTAPAAPPLDASYDWHVLLAAPFGSLLKDAAVPVHEVLVFRDEAPAASALDQAECYALNAKPPRFLARQPEEYLLCYLHDRLARVEATVRIPSTEAAQVFADACGSWMKKASGQLADGCSGSDEGIAFSGRLEVEADQAEAVLTVRLEPFASPDK